MMQRAAEGLAVCLQSTPRGPEPEVSRSPSPDGPLGCNAVLGNVVGPTVLGVVRNYDGGAAPICVCP